MSKEDRLKKIFFLCLILLIQIIIYLPQVGRGFVTDDFVWLSNIVIDGRVDYFRPLTITTGFFRPLVSWTFGIQYQLHGMDPRFFGWFNLFLHLVNILLVYLLLSSVEISRPYALWAAALFGLNSKGPPMAVGWISGRTTLLFACFALLSLYLYLKIRQKHPLQGWNSRRIILYFLVGIIYFAALLSKESAVAVPIFVFLASLIDQKKSNNKNGSRLFLESIRKAFTDTVVFLIPLILYFYMRLGSNAIVPLNAPEYYRLTLTPMMILRNLVEYITRSGMLDMIMIACMLIVLLITRSKKKPAEGIPPLIFVAGTGWFFCFLLPTLLIPARSDIYVYFPQLGVHLVALPIFFYLWKKNNLSIKRKFYRAIAFLPVGMFIFICVWANVFIASANGEKGKSSTVFIQQVLHFTSKMKTGDHVIIIDLQPDRAFSPGHTVSYGFTGMLHLYIPRKYLTGEIVPASSVAKIKCDKKKPGFFFWGDGHMKGPLQCRELKHMIYFLYPHPAMLVEAVKKLKKPVTTRRYRLRKRKKNLRRIKALKKNNMT